MVKNSRVGTFLPDRKRTYGTATHRLPEGASGRFSPGAIVNADQSAHTS